MLAQGQLTIYQESQVKLQSSLLVHGVIPPPEKHFAFSLLNFIRFLPTGSLSKALLNGNTVMKYHSFLKVCIKCKLAEGILCPLCRSFWTQCQPLWYTARDWLSVGLSVTDRNNVGLSIQLSLHVTVHLYSPHFNSLSMRML